MQDKGSANADEQATGLRQDGRPVDQPALDTLHSLVGQSHDYCEFCGARHDFDVPPGTERIYRCDCGGLMCRRTVPNTPVDQHEVSGLTSSSQ